MTFGIRKVLRASYDEALGRVPEALKSEGFGMLTEIDVQSTLKQKLRRRLSMLQDCRRVQSPTRPPSLETELEIGLMLPCNVIVHEGDDRRAVVAAMDPTTTMAVRAGSSSV